RGHNFGMSVISSRHRDGPAFATARRPKSNPTRGRVAESLAENIADSSAVVKRSCRFAREHALALARDCGIRQQIWLTRTAGWIEVHRCESEPNAEFGTKTPRSKSLRATIT